MGSTSFSVFAASQPKDSATKVYRHQIEINPALTKALHENEAFLDEQGRQHDVEPALIATVIRHNSRGSTLRPTSKKGGPTEYPVLASPKTQPYGWEKRRENCRATG